MSQRWAAYVGLFFLGIVGGASSVFAKVPLKVEAKRVDVPPEPHEDIATERKGVLQALSGLEKTSPTEDIPSSDAKIQAPVLNTLQDSSAATAAGTETVQPLPKPAEATVKPVEEAPVDTGAKLAEKTPEAPVDAGAKPAEKEPEAQKDTAVSSSVEVPGGSNVPIPGVFSKGFSSVAKKIIPAVVNVSTMQEIEPKEAVEMPRMPGGPLDMFKDFLEQFERGQPRRIQSLGSGFIIQSEGTTAYVVTNYHVIADSKTITIILHDKTQLKVEVHAYDERTDLAVLKVDTSKLPEKKQTLPTVAWGSSTNVEVGEWVLAFGNPFGLGSSVTVGIVSNRARDISGYTRSRVSEYINDLIQHDASINRGNSGGALTDGEGRVIGINTAIFSPTGAHVGIGFAIPSEIAQHTVDQLIRFGRVKWGWIGVSIQNLDEKMAESQGLGDIRGAIVANVDKKGPAAKAGLKRNDIIVGFNGQALSEDSRLSRIVGETPPGTKVPVTVLRNKKNLKLTVVIGESKQKSKDDSDKDAKKVDGEEKKAKGELKFLGLTLRDLTKELRDQYQIGEKTQGVLVTAVRVFDTPLEAGDVISEVNRNAVKMPQEFKAKIEAARKAGRKNVMIFVKRGASTLFYTTIRIDEHAENGDQKKEGEKTAS